MALFICIVIVIFSMILHEIAHAVLMKRKGVHIHTIGIGLPCGFLRISFKDKRFFNANIEITPLLLGAYVAPSKYGADQMEKLPWKDKAEIYGAGPWVNIIWGNILFVGATIALTDLDSISWLAVSLLFVPMLHRRYFSLYFMPVIGSALFAYVAYEFYSVFSDAGKSVSDVVGGPLFMVQYMSENSRALSEAIRTGGLLSASIGLFNCFPLGPLDGGQSIRDLLLEKKSGIVSLYFKASWVVFAAIIVIAIGGDIVGLFK